MCSTGVRAEGLSTPQSACGSPVGQRRTVAQFRDHHLVPLYYICAMYKTCMHTDGGNAKIVELLLKCGEKLPPDFKARRKIETCLHQKHLSQATHSWVYRLRVKKLSEIALCKHTSTQTVIWQPCQRRHCCTSWLDLSSGHSCLCVT